MAAGRPPPGGVVNAPPSVEWRVVESNDPRGFYTVCLRLAVAGWVYVGHEGDVLRRPSQPLVSSARSVEPAWCFVRHVEHSAADPDGIGTREM